MHLTRPMVRGDYVLIGDQSVGLPDAVSQQRCVDHHYLLLVDAKRMNFPQDNKEEHCLISHIKLPQVRQTLTYSTLTVDY